MKGATQAEAAQLAAPFSRPLGAQELLSWHDVTDDLIAARVIPRSTQDRHLDVLWLSGNGDQRWSLIVIDTDGSLLVWRGAPLEDAVADVLPLAVKRGQYKADLRITEEFARAAEVVARLVSESEPCDLAEQREQEREDAAAYDDWRDAQRDGVAL